MGVTISPARYRIVKLIINMKKLFPVLLVAILSLNCCAQEASFTSGSASKIYYRVFGSGKPLVIINGGPGMNSNGFVDLAKHLSNNNQVILYDQRGTGKSTLDLINKSTVTMDLMIEDLELLRNHLKIEKWAVLGHSFGGILGSYYATIHPERIDKLILSSSGGIDLELRDYVMTNINAKLSQSERDSLAYWNSRIANGDTSFQARLSRGMNLAPAYVYDRKFIPVIARRLTEGNSTINNLVWEDLVRIKFDCAGKLQNFKQPVLIIQGKQDIIAEKTALKAAGVLKNSRVVLMDHCVHYGWLDNPEVFFKEVNEFLLSS